MAMKETERSLRWFFLVAGTLSAIQALSTMSALDKLSLQRRLDEIGQRHEAAHKA